MAIKVGGTTVIDDSRALNNITSVDATTVAALGTAGVGAGGGKFTATADGAIAAGKSVALQANGTVKQIAETITENNPISTLTDSEVAPSPSNADWGYDNFYYFPDTSLGNSAACDGSTIHVWNAGGDVYVTTTNYFASSNSFEVRHGNIFLGDNFDGSGLATAFDPSTGRLLAVWRDTSGYLRNGFIRFYVTSGGSPGQLVYNMDNNNQTSHQVRSSSAVPISAGFSPSDGYFRVGYISNISHLRAITYQMTGAAGSSPSLTESGSQNIASSLGNTEYHWMAHDSTYNRFMITVRNGVQSDHGYYYYFSTNTSNGTVTNHANGAFYSGAAHTTRCEFNPQDGCFLAVFGYGSGTGMKQIDVNSNGTVSVVGGTGSVFQESNDVSERMDLKYDIHSKKIVFVRRTTTNTYSLDVMKINTSGSSISKEALRTLPAHGVNNVTGITAIEEHNKFVVAQAKDNGAFQYTTLAIASSSTNNTSWIGFAEGAISDTASGDILVVGSTAENQSGLTIGSVYYVKVDGTLTTTALNAVKAGRAIATNKLLITEGNA
jgi:hypothetical protein